MELNQDEDVGSWKMKKEKQESDVFGELKMPVEGSVDIGDQKLGFGEEGEVKKHSDNSTKRVCEICEKEFRSGKALGGHMSSHVQLKKNMKLKEEEEEEGVSDFLGKKKYGCAICDKGFPSMKALSGHMRCHPERPWRGINPPPPTTDAINPPIEQQFMNPPMEQQFVDLTESLTGWRVTAKRGRKAIPEEEHQAVNFLMMLARGEKDDSGAVDNKVVEMKKKKRRRKKVKLCDVRLMEGGDRDHRDELHSFDSSLTETGILNIDLNQLPSW